MFQNCFDHTPKKNILKTVQDLFAILFQLNPNLSNVEHKYWGHYYTSILCSHLHSLGIDSQRLASIPLRNHARVLYKLCFYSLDIWVSACPCTIFLVYTFFTLVSWKRCSATALLHVLLRRLMLAFVSYLIFSLGGTFFESLIVLLYVLELTFPGQVSPVPNNIQVFFNVWKIFLDYGSK